VRAAHICFHFPTNKQLNSEVPAKKKLGLANLFSFDDHMFAASLKRVGLGQTAAELTVGSATPTDWHDGRRGRAETRGYSK
jgi:hypothetical protein